MNRRQEGQEVEAAECSFVEYHKGIERGLGLGRVDRVAEGDGVGFEIVDVEVVVADKKGEHRAVIVVEVGTVRIVVVAVAGMVGRCIESVGRSELVR